MPQTLTSKTKKYFGVVNVCTESGAESSLPICTGLGRTSWNCTTRVLNYMKITMPPLVLIRRPQITGNFRGNMKIPWYKFKIKIEFRVIQTDLYEEFNLSTKIVL